MTKDEAVREAMKPLIKYVKQNLDVQTTAEGKSALMFWGKHLREGIKDLLERI